MKKLVTFISLLFIISEIALAQTFSATDEKTNQRFTYMFIDGDNVCIKACENTTYTGTLTIPEYVYYRGGNVKVSYIANYAFTGDTNITRVILPSSLLYIGEFAFSGTFIDSIDIPNTVQYIGAGAFMSCYHLKDIWLPTSLQDINASTFKMCDSLQHIFIPMSVKHIDVTAFDNCSNLSNIEVNQYNETFTSFDGILYDYTMTTIYKCMPGCILVNNIPNTVSYIKEGAFKGCSKLKEVELPPSITTIPDEAFMFCFDLEKVVLPPHIIKIGEYAFSNCQSLKQINIPNSCKKIEYRAFETCLKLSTKVFPKQFRIPKMLKYIGK